MNPRPKSTDLPGLEALALAQGGYFDSGDARAHGISADLVRYHLRSGRFERVFPGVYRLQTAPRAHYDELILAWVWSNYRGAVSHEGALALYELSDVMPDRVHLTVPPVFGRASSNFALHRAVLRPDELAMYEGVQVTTVARSIVDAAAEGVDPEQVQKAIGQALERAMVSPEQLRAAAARPGYRHKRVVQPLIDASVAHAAA